MRQISDAHVVTLGSMSLAVLVGLGGCSAREEPSHPENQATSVVAVTRPSPREFYAVLVVEQRGGDLKVTSSSKVTAKSLGKAAKARGNGGYVVGWSLRAKMGEIVEAGEIAVSSDLHVPPDPNTGAPAAHFEQTPAAFTLRAPWPEPGETLEMSTSDGSAKGVWP
jgi:hypothetical protein